MIDFYINKIKKYPELHDKIEFELINTCFDFSLLNEKFLPLNTSEKKIFISLLRKLTNNIINLKNATLDKEIEKINILKQKISSIKKSKLSHIQKIYYLVSDCKRYGTLPFAGVARCAFISKSILDSLCDINLINNNDLDNFYRSINTISKKINIDYFNSKKKIHIGTF